jgi:hypothetical protein
VLAAAVVSALAEDGTESGLSSRLVLSPAGDVISAPSPLAADSALAQRLDALLTGQHNLPGAEVELSLRRAISPSSISTLAASPALQATVRRLGVFENIAANAVGTRKLPAVATGASAPRLIRVPAAKPAAATISTPGAPGALAGRSTSGFNFGSFGSFGSAPANSGMTGPASTSSFSFGGSGLSAAAPSALTTAPNALPMAPKPEGPGAAAIFSPVALIRAAWSRCRLLSTSTSVELVAAAQKSLTGVSDENFGRVAASLFALSAFPRVVADDLIATSALGLTTDMPEGLVEATELAAALRAGFVQLGEAVPLLTGIAYQLTAHLVGALSGTVVALHRQDTDAALLLRDHMETQAHSLSASYQFSPRHPASDAVEAPPPPQHHAARVYLAIAESIDGHVHLLPAFWRCDQGLGARMFSFVLSRVDLSIGPMCGDALIAVTDLMTASLPGSLDDAAEVGSSVVATAAATIMDRKLSDDDGFCLGSLVSLTARPGAQAHSKASLQTVPFGAASPRPGTAAEAGPAGSSSLDELLPFVFRLAARLLLADDSCFTATTESPSLQASEPSAALRTLCSRAAAVIGMEHSVSSQFPTWDASSQQPPPRGNQDYGYYGQLAGSASSDASNDLVYARSPTFAAVASAAVELLLAVKAAGHGPLVPRALPTALITAAAPLKAQLEASNPYAPVPVLPKAHAIATACVAATALADLVAAFPVTLQAATPVLIDALCANPLALPFPPGARGSLFTSCASAFEAVLYAANQADADPTADEVTAITRAMGISVESGLIRASALSTEDESPLNVSGVPRDEVPTLLSALRSGADRLMAVLSAETPVLRACTGILFDAAHCVILGAGLYAPTLALFAATGASSGTLFAAAEAALSLLLASYDRASCTQVTLSRSRLLLRSPAHLPVSGTSASTGTGSGTGTAPAPLSAALLILLDPSVSTQPRVQSLSSRLLARLEQDAPHQVSAGLAASFIAPIALSRPAFALTAFPAAPAVLSLLATAGLPGSTSRSSQSSSLAGLLLQGLPRCHFPSALDAVAELLRRPHLISTHADIAADALALLGGISAAAAQPGSAVLERLEAIRNGHIIPQQMASLVSTLSGASLIPNPTSSSAHGRAGASLVVLGNSATTRPSEIAATNPAIIYNVSAALLRLVASEVLTASTSLSSGTTAECAPAAAVSGRSLLAALSVPIDSLAALDVSVTAFQNSPLSTAAFPAVSAAAASIPTLLGGGAQLPAIASLLQLILSSQSGSASSAAPASAATAGSLAFSSSGLRHSGAWNRLAASHRVPREAAVVYADAEAAAVDAWASAAVMLCRYRVTLDEDVQIADDLMGGASTSTPDFEYAGQGPFEGLPSAVSLAVSVAASALSLACTHRRHMMPLVSVALSAAHCAKRAVISAKARDPAASFGQQAPMIKQCLLLSLDAILAAAPTFTADSDVPSPLRLAAASATAAAQVCLISLGPRALSEMAQAPNALLGAVVRALVPAAVSDSNPDRMAAIAALDVAITFWPGAILSHLEPSVLQRLACSAVVAPSAICGAGPDSSQIPTPEDIGSVLAARSALLLLSRIAALPQAGELVARVADSIISALGTPEAHCAFSSSLGNTADYLPALAASGLAASFPESLEDPLDLTGRHAIMVASPVLRRAILLHPRVTVISLYGPAAIGAAHRWVALFQDILVDAVSSASRMLSFSSAVAPESAQFARLHASAATQVAENVFHLAEALIPSPEAGNVFFSPSSGDFSVTAAKLAVRHFVVFSTSLWMSLAPSNGPSLGAAQTVTPLPPLRGLRVCLAMLRATLNPAARAAAAAGSDAPANLGDAGAASSIPGNASFPLADADDMSEAFFSLPSHVEGCMSLLSGTPADDANAGFDVNIEEHRALLLENVEAASFCIWQTLTSCPPGHLRAALGPQGAHALRRAAASMATCTQSAAVLTVAKRLDVAVGI